MTKMIAKDDAVRLKDSNNAEWLKFLFMGLKSKRKTEGFAEVEYPEPHLGRRKQLLVKYPEIRKLFGNTPSTAIHIALLISAQIGLAVLLRNQPIWIILAASWFVGAFLGHSLWVMIHESAHNLILKSSAGNRWMGILANLPLIFPAAMGFRTYHLIHHQHQGEMDHDADLAGPIEARLVGNCPIRKTLWLLNFWIVEGITRPARLKNVQLWDRWVVTNLVVQLAFCAAMIAAFGWMPILYFFLSFIFSVGLHPVGARWIQEHYLIVPGQETYSYYGPLNWVCYNVGYHNEHHDLMMVPWSRLKKVKEMAPEFYDSLHSHQSWSKLLVRFIFDKKMSLYSRAVRTSR